MKLRISILLFACGLICSSASCSHTERGHAVAHVDWLPRFATDITYVKKSGQLWELDYECTMSRKDFDGYAMDQNWKAEERKDFTTGSRKVLGLPVVRKELWGIDFYPIALVYESFRGTGGGILVVYDPERERLYVHKNSD